MPLCVNMLSSRLFIYIHMKSKIYQYMIMDSTNFKTANLKQDIIKVYNVITYNYQFIIVL